MEAREADVVGGGAELVGEEAEPALVRRVDDPEEVVPERPGRAVGVSERDVAPARAFVLADGIDRGVAERQRARTPHRLGELPHRRERDRPA